MKKLSWWHFKLHEYIKIAVIFFLYTIDNNGYFINILSLLNIINIIMFSADICVMVYIHKWLIVQFLGSLCNLLIFLNIFFIYYLLYLFTFILIYFEFIFSEHYDITSGNLFFLIIIIDFFWIIYCFNQLVRIIYNYELN